MSAEETKRDPSDPRDEIFEPVDIGPRTSALDALTPDRQKHIGFIEFLRDPRTETLHLIKEGSAPTEVQTWLYAFPDTRESKICHSLSQSLDSCWDTRDTLTEIKYFLDFLNSIESLLDSDSYENKRIRTLIIAPHIKVQTKLFLYSMQSRHFKTCAQIAKIILQKAKRQKEHLDSLEPDDASIAARTLLIEKLHQLSNMILEAYQLCLMCSNPIQFERNLESLISAILVKNRDLLRVKRHSLTINTKSGLAATKTERNLSSFEVNLNAAPPKLNSLNGFAMVANQALYAKKAAEDNKPIINPAIFIDFPELAPYFHLEFLARYFSLVKDSRDQIGVLNWLSEKTPDSANFYPPNLFLDVLLPLISPETFEYMLCNNKILNQWLGLDKQDGEVTPFGYCNLVWHISNIKNLTSMNSRIAQMTPEEMTMRQRALFQVLYKFLNTKRHADYITLQTNNCWTLTLIAYGLYVAPGKTFDTTTSADKILALTARPIMTATLRIPRISNDIKRYLDRHFPGIDIVRRHDQVRKEFGYEKHDDPVYKKICNITKLLQLKARDDRRLVTTRPDKIRLHLLANRVWDIYEAVKPLLSYTATLESKLSDARALALYKIIGELLLIYKVLIRRERISLETRENKRGFTKRFSTMDKLYKQLPKLARPTGLDTPIPTDHTDMQIAEDRHAPTLERPFDESHREYADIMAEIEAAVPIEPDAVYTSATAVRELRAEPKAREMTTFPPSNGAGAGAGTALVGLDLL